MILNHHDFVKNAVYVLDALAVFGLVPFVLRELWVHYKKSTPLTHVLIDLIKHHALLVFLLVVIGLSNWAVTVFDDPGESDARQRTFETKPAAPEDNPEQRPAEPLHPQPLAVPKRDNTQNPTKSVAKSPQSQSKIPQAPTETRPEDGQSRLYFVARKDNGLILINDLDWGANDDHGFVKITYTAIADIVKPKTSVIQLSCCIQNGQCYQQKTELPPSETLSRGAQRQQIIALPTKAFYVEAKFNNPTQ